MPVAGLVVELVGHRDSRVHRVRAICVVHVPTPTGHQLEHPAHFAAARRDQPAIRDRHPADPTHQRGSGAVERTS